MGWLKLRVTERIQAGDVFLFKALCPQCAKETLMGYPLTHFECCKIKTDKALLLIGQRRLLCGTQRKKRLPSKTLIRHLLEVQGNQCAYCYWKLGGEEYHVDHILPLSVGGTNERSNLCICCAQCNKIAGAKVFASVGAKALYIQSKRKRPYPKLTVVEETPNG